ncbi:MAG TPA: glycoside hydrolase family 15 protein [Thermoanaerobaculia bacterium]
MPRDLPIGNGSLLVAFDAQYRLADFYFPRVGMENQVSAGFRFGVEVRGEVHAVDQTSWQRTLDYLRDTLVTDVTLHNESLGLRIRCYDTVDPDSNVYLRKIVVKNMEPEQRDIRLLFHHDFGLYGNSIGDTVMYDPKSKAMIQYKTRRYVLASCEGGVAEYACGRSASAGGAGTWPEGGGGLAMSAVAQGAVDFTFVVPIRLAPEGTATTHYWICAGRSAEEVRRLDLRIREETPGRMLSRSGSYWYTWVNKPGIDLVDLPDEIVDIYRRSLLVVATQVDRGGGVLAANDSDIQWGHNDHYSYVWPRDAAFVCDAMGRAGFPEIAQRFLRFADKTISDEGYFLHKYNADGSPAPLWHPWVRDGEPQLPIQEDETALVIWLLARHYARTRDLDLLRSVYERLVRNAADFLVAFRDPATGLPLPSYDIWEERRGVFTFTSAAVWAGLDAAAGIANLFNDQERRATYAAAASEIRDAIRTHLWIENEGRFARGLVDRDGKPVLDTTVDSSLFAIFYLGVFPATSAIVEGTMQAIRDRLTIHTETGGVARYEDDPYHRISEERTRVPGNPWILCTLWLAEFDLARATNTDALHAALDAVRWARARATSSMILPEQLDPYDGQPLSVAPLTWSHAQIISLVHAHLDGQRRLR